MAAPRTRLITLDDAEELSALLGANRAFLAPWEPLLAPQRLTPAGQRTMLGALLDGYARGTTVPHVVLDGARIVGRITLGQIVRVNLQSATLGYWIAQADNGRGHATGAVARICELAFGELGLHRVQAGTLVHNHASQAVLARNHFVRIGLAPGYLEIAGAWQDHVLFQRLAPAPRGTTADAPR